MSLAPLKILLTMLEKSCSSADRLARIETCCFTDLAKFILEQAFSVTVVSQLMALSRMSIYVLKRFASPLRIDPSISRTSNGQTSTVIALKQTMGKKKIK